MKKRLAVPRASAVGLLVFGMGVLPAFSSVHRPDREVRILGPQPNFAWVAADGLSYGSETSVPPTRLWSISIGPSQLRASNPNAIPAVAANRLEVDAGRPAFVAGAADPVVARRALNAFAKLPLGFIANAGQVDEEVRYYAQGRGFRLAFTRQAVVLSLVNQGASKESDPASIVAKPGSESEPAEEAVVSGATLALRFLDANPQAQLESGERLPGAVSYFTGNDPALWRTGLAMYQQMAYRELWPGVDLQVRGQGGALEYEFVVQPGVKLEGILLGYEGADGLAVDAAGALVIETPVGELRQSAPVTYQTIEGRRVELESRYVPAGDRKKNGYGFAVGAAYDPHHALVIDAGLHYSSVGGSSMDSGSSSAADAGLIYSTFLGGRNGDAGFDVAVDAAGNAYVTGFTASPNFPTTPGAFDVTFGHSDRLAADAFVTKLNATGSALVYSTFLGGDARDESFGVEVDAAGNAYVTGVTESPDFPTTPGAVDVTLDRPDDAFVTKLNATGSALLYSTFLGGRIRDLGSDVAVDTAGNAYVTGTTFSDDFPTTAGAFDVTLAGDRDAFVTKLNATGSALVYSTFLGGGSFDVSSGSAVDAAGNAYVTGETFSDDFPTTPGAFDVTNGSDGDAFVTKLNATGSALVYSTFLGGEIGDSSNDVAVDAAGNAYVTGFTVSPDFPTTPGAFDVTLDGSDAFVTRLNATGSVLLYSTLLGGGSFDESFGVAVDAGGNAYVTGSTVSRDFPTTAGAFDVTLEGSDDAFVTKLNATGSALLYSTFLGGRNTESFGVFGVALDAAGNAYVTGGTFSRDFPTTPGAFDVIFNGFRDAFVTKFALAPGVSCGGLSATLVGTQDDDDLVGTSGPDVIAGLGGNDRLDGGRADDVLCGGAGADVLLGGGGADKLLGEVGRDQLFGEDGKDILAGGPDDDDLDGGRDNDTLKGGVGGDRLDGDGGFDSCPDVEPGDTVVNCENQED